jgi:hypothetical protein
VVLFILDAFDAESLLTFCAASSVIFLEQRRSSGFKEIFPKGDQ